MDASVLIQKFSECFSGSVAAGVCRAPGRVNLIGEHTDYNGLAVLPMTIEEDIRIAFARGTDSAVVIRDVDPAYAESRFENGAEIAPSRAGSWENYCKAAVQALNRHFGVRDFPGMNVLVHGSVPVAAGLSSSSALVVACALAYLRVIGKELGADISRADLASLLAEGEHYVGTRGGGMDQAVILLGRKDAACKIDFYPLRTEPAPLPEGCVFVVCDSLVKAQKTGDALHRYNAGPLCCKLICALVEKKAQEEFGEEIVIERLGELWQGHLCLTDKEVEDLFARAFPRPTTRLEEAARALGLTTKELRARWLGDLAEPPGGFPLQARARHQLTEYRRVERARDALLAGDAAEFGRLMDASHASCAGDYAVSCPELDALVAIARRGGAMGSRLTGAGFGGCTVSLVEADKADELIQAVEENYYGEYLRERGVPLRNGRIIVARASEGAGYLAV